MRTRKVLGLAALCVAIALTTPACGNRLSTKEVLAQNRVSAADSGSGGLSAGTGDERSAAGTDTGIASVSGSGGTTASAAGSGDATTGAGTSTSGGAAATGSGGTKSPIVVGYIAWLSGLGGDTIAPSRDALVAWAKAVNARGGINGHPVQMLIGDHGGDESRTLSIAKDFVENKGAIALFANMNGGALADYVKSKGIPLIGGIPTGGNVWITNPYLFPPWGTDLDTAWGAANLIKRAGFKKVGAMYCAESPDCQSGAARFANAVKEAGLELVSQQQYSETQPDFTSECIQLRGAGAETVYPTGSTAAMIRMARACSRQGFRPVWIAPTMDDSIATNPDFDGAISSSSAFPWFLRTGSPAVEEYAGALAKYAPSRQTKGNTFMSYSWVSAKLFEKAAENVSDKPTPQDILDGLWSMKGETLGGLVPPRTFVRMQPTPETYCIYEGRVSGGKWVAPDGMRPLCR